MSNMDNNKKDDELGSFYMNRQRPLEPEPRRMLPRGLLTVLTVLAFIAVIWYAYPRGTEKFSDIDIPTISADKATYKFKPENPGGMDVPHQDSTVFDPIEKKSVDNVERLRPGTEEPIDKDAAIKSAPIDKQSPKLNLDMQMKENADGTEKVVPKGDEKTTAIKNGVIRDAGTDKRDAMPPQPKAAETKTAETKTADAKPTATDEEADSDDSGNDADETVTEDKTPDVKTDTKTEVKKAEEKPESKPADAKKPAAPAPKAAAKETPKEAAAALAKGQVYLQFGAYHDVATANKEWAKLQGKYPQLKGLPMRTEIVHAAAGMLQRLQAGRVSGAKAKEICDAIRAKGDACITVY